MTRLAALLLLVGGVLLISWAVAPAAPIQQTPELRAKALAGEERQEEVQALAEVNAHVDRLRERLSERVIYPSPARDPFRFGRAVTRPTLATPEVAAEPAPAPAPQLPKLVAVLTEKGENGSTYRAVMTLGSDVSVLKVGEKIARFTIRAITADAAELVDTDTQQIFRLALK